MEQVDGLPAHYYAQSENPLPLSERIEHAEIVSALQSRDTVGLKAVLRRHLVHSCQGILAYLKRVEQDSNLSEAKETSIPRTG